MRTIYWILGGIVAVLCIVGLITYSGEKETERAQQKARELTVKLEHAGFRAPQQEILVRTLGDDGGNVCDNPGDAFGKALIADAVANGASHVGRRPVIGDRRVVAGELLILDTYCPDELKELGEEIEDWKFDNVIDS
jgi:hypothetical protein